ncbi:MAG: sulfate permease [Chitinophagaceae bacterium]|nr:sulfate permease [Chitinophagaceae bacterium]
MFRPKLFEALKDYSRLQFSKDLMAGLIVGIVALPLAIAFAIASGVSPEKGLITAIIAGFLISVLGGSKVQIGGPTGAFIVIVFGIVNQHGVSGLIIATFMAGIMLIIMGLAKMGSVIKFIPHPLITGFTSGIAVIIFSAQIKDLFGLQMDKVPAEFVEKWIAYGSHISTVNWIALIIGIVTIVVVVFSSKVTRIIPGSLIAIVLSTIAVQLFDLPVETIGSRFGSIPSTLPAPVIPSIDWATIKSLLAPAFTIALLGAIESLLSAVVADGMIGGNHRSNTELIAQGGANIASALFGGIPATGAIARTATNVKNGGRTPVAGMVHAVTLLIIMLLFGKWASMIPMATLAGILVVVAYNMSEHETFFDIARGIKSDAAVLLTTFFFTIFFDLIIAIQIGMVMAAFLFMRQMIQISNVNVNPHKEEDTSLDANATDKFNIPEGVDVFEITGPMFFGAAYKFKDSMRFIEKKPKVLILRMRNVPVIDATGLNTIKDVLKMCNHDKTILVLSGIQPNVFEELRKSRLLFKIGKRFVVPSFKQALDLTQKILIEKDDQKII